MPEELDNITRTKGLQVIHLSHPTQTVIDNVDNIKWSIDSTSLKLSILDFSSLNVAIVTTYKHLKHEKMLAFVGSTPSSTLSNNDYVYSDSSGIKDQSF